MRILMLVPDIDPTGGGGRHAGNIADGLRATGNEVELLKYEDPFWSFTMRARRQARHADIVHVIDINPAGFVGFFATRLTRAKLVITTQGTYAVAPLYSAKLAWFSKIVYRGANAVVAISSFTAREIQKKIPGLTITIIDPGINLAKFSNVGERHPEPLVLGVGSVKARKGYDVSLRAFALLKKKMPELRYTIVGSQTDEPGFFKRLKELADELGVADAVEFRTNISDTELTDLYRRAGVFVLTSVNDSLHFEGYGMVFVEAAAYGVPGVGTSGNGIEDAIEDGRTGLLVPQRDPRATTDAMERILTDHALNSRMSARGPEFAREHDIPHMIARYQDLYRKILQK
jgi:phosphatidylinositol alpha-1,6-mannosyltransferase